VYGFRSEIAVLGELSEVATNIDILPVELVDEAFYHGDTVLCAFGRGRTFLLAYLDGLAAPAVGRLTAWFGDHLVPLGREDAELYAANAFSLAHDGGAFLFMPAGVSSRLQVQVRERGVEPVLVDVSEFLRKGGGAVKCMIGDLGPWIDEGIDESVRAFRTAHRYAAHRPAGRSAERTADEAGRRRV
jgi:N-dimethylarginine dimethylaminohydrolase